MIRKSLKQHIEKEGWRGGSIWELDWYIDLIFCHAMAYGTNPCELKYIQPILDDEFINNKINDGLVEKNIDFFKNKKALSSLTEKQNEIISNSRNLIEKLKSDTRSVDLDYYYKIQYDLSLLMASVSTVFDKLVEKEIDRLAKKHEIKTELLSNYVIGRSSITSLNQSNKELLILYEEYKQNFDLYFETNKKLAS